MEIVRGKLVLADTPVTKHCLSHCHTVTPQLLTTPSPSPQLTVLHITGKRPRVRESHAVMPPDGSSQTAHRRSVTGEAWDETGTEANWT
eukprot:1042074-Amorphochlora_amoeboformis.AAC.1